MRRWLLVALAAAVMLFCAIGVLLVNGVSLGLATPYLEKQASAWIQRELEFGTAPRLRIADSLVIRVDDVAIANADWAGGADLLHLDTATLRVDLRSLFSPQIFIDDLQLSGLRLDLRTDRSGRSNLPELGRENPKSDGDDQAPLPFALHQASIRNVSLTRSNEQTGIRAELFVSALTVESPSEQALKLRASGTLQERAWNLALDGSGTQAMRGGRNLFAEFEGSLGDLTLTGDYRQPDARNLGDLSLNAVLEGSVPARIAELSPLLTAAEPLRAVLKVVDEDPGLGVDLRVEVSNFGLAIAGSIARPEEGDGLNLTTRLDAGSLPRLAQALDLGPADELPLRLSGTIRREGRRIELSGVEVDAGEHRIRGEVSIPDFPNTKGSAIDLSASGPDFTLYQRLLKRPPSLAVPYTINARLEAGSDTRERIEGEVGIGDHSLRLAGALDNYPSYRGSALRFNVDSPSLRDIAALFDLKMPDAPFAMHGELSVSDDDWITVKQVRAEALGIDANLTGQLRSYPDLDRLDLHLDAKLDSLADLGRQFGVETLGDVAATFSVDASGASRNPVLSNPRLEAGGLRASATRGALRVVDGELRSNLQLAVELQDLPTLLGSYAVGGIPKDLFTFDLLPRFTPEQSSLALKNIKGPGISGSAELGMTPDLQVNEQSRLTTDLRFDDLSQLLPEIGSFRPPSRPVELVTETLLVDTTTLIATEISDERATLLTAKFRIPAGNPASRSSRAVSVSLRGSGEDLRRLGTHPAVPDEPLPYAIELDAEITDKQLTITAKRVDLAGTELRGNASWEPASRTLVADLTVPKGNLDLWLPPPSGAAATDQGSPGTAATSSAATDGRIIPDMPLPIQWLDSHRLDVQLSTGPLGLSNPNFAQESLIDALELSLVSGNGGGTLTVDRLVGSIGRVEGRLEVVKEGNAADMHTQWSFEDFPLGYLTAQKAFDRLPRHSITTTLHARGNNLRQLAATLDGDFLLTGDAGALQAMRMGFATESFIAQLVTTVLPMLKNGDTDMQVDCTVLAARARQGIVSLNPGFVLRTRKVDLLARGEVNLRNEKISIRFDNHARRGLGISAAGLINPYVAISGTLAKPALGLDIANSALSGGAAVASGGLTVLAKPLFERLTDSTNPCDVALKRWNKLATD